jgi:biopolymer transport protein TolQ
MEVTIAREIELLERRLLVLATVDSTGPFVGLFGTVWGHHDQLPVDRGLQEHLPAVVARDRGGPVRDRDRPRGRHTGDDFLQ